jgi:hypothetical protein
MAKATDEAEERKLSDLSEQELVWESEAGRAMSAQVLQDGGGYKRVEYPTSDAGREFLLALPVAIRHETATNVALDIAANGAKSEHKELVDR